MSQMRDYRYDVFVSYNAADQDWVATVLLPRLEAAGLRVAIDYRDFVVGKPLVENIEDIVTASRRTIVVLSPAWLANEWNAFEALLLRAEDPAATRRKLLPLRLRPCDLPAGLAKLKLDVADLTAERYKETQLKRLVRDVEDVVPVSLPSRVRDWGAWRRWLRRYRRQVRWTVALTVLLWLLLSMTLQLYPFQPRDVWVAESLQAPYAQILHNTGTMLLVGGANVEATCNVTPRGIWYRSLAEDSPWHASQVDDELCIETRVPPALSDIVALASLPDHPDTVYALSSHTGVFVSTDGGATFGPHSAGDPDPDPANRPVRMIVTEESGTPIFWVAGGAEGVYVYRDGQWSRLDGQSGACVGLPALTIRSLSVEGKTVLLGSLRRGLWVSDDGGRTCRQTFDSAGKYEFRGVWDVSTSSYNRYLVLVYDTQVEPGDPQGTWRLLILCPRAASCSATDWGQDPEVVWGKSTVVNDVFVSPGVNVDYEWYLVTEFGQVWHGDLRGSEPRQMPGINRCFLSCNAAFAIGQLGEAPYLLAANLVDEQTEKWLGPGRVYRYTLGAWWRRLWP